MFFEKVAFEHERGRLDGASQKFAMDLAALLTWTTEMFEVDTNAGRSIGPDFMSIHERFNACIVQNGGEPLPMEVRWAWPMAVEISDWLANTDWSPIEKKQLQMTFDMIISLATADDMYRAVKNEYPGRSVPEHILTVVSIAACLRGLPPSREHLMCVALQSAADLPAPLRTLSVLCLDDSPDAALRTLMCMAGWSNLQFATHLQPEPAVDELRETTTDQLANAVIASGAHIVLMDYGLRNTNGAAVIHAVDRIDPNGERVFVANTGGDPAKFDGTGAIGNCDKGAHLDSIVEAIFSIDW